MVSFTAFCWASSSRHCGNIPSGKLLANSDLFGAETNLRIVNLHQMRHSGFGAGAAVGFC